MDNNFNPTWSANQDFLDTYIPLIEQIESGFHCYNYAVKELRLKVFRHTVSIVKNGYYITDSGKRIELDNQHEMVTQTQFYKDVFSVAEIPTENQTTQVSVIKEDCLIEGMRLKAEGYNPAVLNVASRYTPGGGSNSGAAALEETIFRRTNLCLSLYQYADFAEIYGLKKSQNQYPLDQDFGGIYTPNVTIFREGEKEGYRLMDNPQKMSFISVAAMYRPPFTPDCMIFPTFVEEIKNKIRTILRIGIKHHHDSLVMEAFGCSSFRNPPKHIAKLFHEILDESEFKNKFRLISFAILEDHNSFRRHNREGNYKPFADEFGE